MACCMIEHFPSCLINERKNAVSVLRRLSDLNSKIRQEELRFKTLQGIDFQNSLFHCCEVMT